MAHKYVISVVERDTYDGEIFGGYKIETDDKDEFLNQIMLLDKEIDVENHKIYTNHKMWRSIGEEPTYNFPSIDYTVVRDGE